MKARGEEMSELNENLKWNYDPKPRKPREYTDCEGGSWQPWQARAVSNEELYRKKCAAAHGQPCIWIECIQVHALKFADGTIWDAVNGWRP